MTVFVSMSPQTIYMSGFDPQGDNMDVPVRCLDCDSISQVNIAISALTDTSGVAVNDASVVNITMPVAKIITVRLWHRNYNPSLCLQ